MISEISRILAAFRPCFTREAVFKWFAVCIPLCAELHEGVETIRQFQNKTPPVVEAVAKVSVTALMAAMAADLVSTIGIRCLLVLDTYFAVGPVFAILKQASVWCILLRAPGAM